MKRLSLVLAALLATGVALHAQTAAAPEKLFASARHQETTQGDLRAAIETYRKVVAQAGSNRALAAQALLRLAECHAKLGDAQARQAYERLVRDYGDMPEAKTARARIGAAGATTARTTPATDRIVKAGLDITRGDGRVSPDGRYISYADWDHTGNVILHDLSTGADRPLTGNKAWGTSLGFGSTFSPDGRQVAYGWRTFQWAPTPHVNELRVVPVDAAPGTQSRRVHLGADISQYDAKDWSPDGQWIAVLATRRDRSVQIALVGARDGSFRSLKTVNWRGPRKMFFSPDGKYLAYDLPASDTATNRDVFVMTVDGSRETAIVDHTAQDVVMGWARDGKHLLFASDRSGVVGLWSVPVSDGRLDGPASLLKREIGSILSLGLTASGTLHIVKDASTRSLQVAPVDIGTGRLTGPGALENFRSMRPSWSRDGKHVANVYTGLNGVTGVAVREIGSSAVREIPLALEYVLAPAWMPDGRSLLVHGRDFKGHGGIYRVDLSSGASSFVAASDLCRVKVSPDGTKIYYLLGRATLGAGEPWRLVEHDLSTGERREFTRDADGATSMARPLGVSGQLSPDGRLMAAIVPNDDRKTSTLVLGPTAAGEQVRRVALPRAFGPIPSWLPDGKGVLAWEMSDDGRGRQGHRGGDPLWIVPIDGSAPRRLEVDTRTWVEGDGLSLHPNGTHISYYIGEDTREVWALESIAQR